jgi:NDP-sugar pyrophosphorylase family protein
MKAVVLVGGEGTRLRPITETVKKELLPLVDRPILDHTLDRLVRHGVDEVVMSSPYLEDAFRPFIETRHGVPAITWVTEREALDTGGAIVNALGVLGGDEPFVALNGDILTDLDLTTMVASHRDRGAVATISLTHVEDARAFGLVKTEPGGRVIAFLEKPAELVPGDVNAGTYVLEPSALDDWTPGVRASVERDIFPRLIGDGLPVYGFVSDAYWLDLGTPEKYLQAHADLLDGRVNGHPAYAAPFVRSDAVDPGASVGRHVAIGPGVSVAAGADLRDSVLLDAATVGRSATVHRSILGPRSSVGEGARVVDCVLGVGATVGAGVSLEGVRVGTGEDIRPSSSGQIERM